MKRFLSQHRSFFLILFFFVVGGLLYLPLARQAGYYDDDWFAMYAAKIAGPQIFRDFYVLDSRPGRALVTIPLYMLFHGVPFYYALSAYFFRVVGALTLLWLLRLLWPGNRKETFLAALLFLIYPGFLSMPTPIDFQTHLVGVWMAFLSLGLSLLSISAASRTKWFLLWAGAVVTGLFYLAQMEYYIGFEIIRVLLFLLIFLRRGRGWRQDVAAALKAWLPFAIIPVLFLTWRLFFFTSERKVTDAGLQLGKFSETPIHTSLAWLISLLQDIVNVSLLAWSVPLSQLAFNLDVYNSVVALGLAVLVLLLFLYFFPILNQGDDQDKAPGYDFGKEALWLGLAWVICGLLPVVLGNRQVVFPEFSRYGFVSAGGAAIFVVALIGLLPGLTFQRVVIGLLLVSATLTHYANTARFAEQMADIRSFWWQVSWRVPQFDRGTTIVAHYPLAGIREPSFVWGPADQIYYPNRTKPGPITTGISAIRLDKETVLRILSKDKQYMDPYYEVTAYPNPRHITVITRPTLNSCVQIIDGTKPEYSRYEDPTFLLAGPYSETEKILTDEPPADVPESLFGPEPEHDWCFLYEKAALARQRGDWQEVLRLADQAASKNLKPRDLIEWMPFLQAYALNDRTNNLSAALDQVQSDEYILKQACEKLKSLQVSDDMQSLIASRCAAP
jgi:hypothetical protein